MANKFYQHYVDKREIYNYSSIQAAINSKRNFLARMGCEKIELVWDEKSMTIKSKYVQDGESVDDEYLLEEINFDD